MLWFFEFLCIFDNEQVSDAADMLCGNFMLLLLTTQSYRISLFGNQIKYLTDRASGWIDGKNVIGKKRFKMGKKIKLICTDSKR